MDKELTALERRREKTRAVKQAMMQELLTGKTRLVAREPVHGCATAFRAQDAEPRHLPLHDPAQMDGLGYRYLANG